MNISRVRIQLPPRDRAAPGRDAVLCFADIEFDGEFAVHDAKLVRTIRRVALVMPNAMATAKCPGCAYRNRIAARFCNRCGGRVDAVLEPNHSLYRDTCFPANNAARERIEAAVMAEYERAVAAEGPTLFVPRRSA